MSTLSQFHLHDEVAAYRFVEAILRPNGPVCPRCKETKRVGQLNGKSTKIGVCKCYVCRKPFNVKVGTVFESNHIPLHKWLQAILLLCASKKGFSSHQLARTLDIQVRSAWFLSHRIREAMRSGELAPIVGIVETDETIYGRAATHPKGRKQTATRATNRITNSAHKNVILSLVQRGRGVRSYHIEGSTDMRYEPGRPVIHTNTVENYFSVSKRGLRGVYQHCREKHLHKYLAEFDFRYNARSALGVENLERAERALRGVAGKRLTYRKRSQAQPLTS